MQVDVTELQSGDILRDAPELGTVRSHRPDSNYPDTQEMVYFENGDRETFGKPQKLDVIRPITVTDSGIDEFGGVWVIARGPADKCDAVRRKCAAHARKNGYGRWISAGASFENGGTVVEHRVRYHPSK